MTVSVIVPIYNTEKYLGPCIQSILNQTYNDLQIILIDDGSTDKSGEICDEYAKKDNRIVVRHINNSGVSKARNTALDIVTGDYIAFVDSDDTIRPDMYESLLEIAENLDTDIVTSDFLFNSKVVKNSLEESTVYNEKRIKENVLPMFSLNNAIGVFAFTNKIFKSKLIQSNHIRFYEGFSYQEDLMFMINVYAHAKSLYYLPRAFYEYIPLPTGLYSSYRENSGKKFIEARKIIISLIEDYTIKNIDFLNLNIGFLYNISFFVYRTRNYIHNRTRRNSIIKDTLTDTVVVECCKQLCETAASFDRRIALAIAKGNIKLAVFLINFVHSGKAAKLQKIVAKIKNR